MKVLMFASCYGRGLTQQCTEQGVALHKKLGRNLVVVTSPQEQFSGLFERLNKERVHHSCIEGLDVHQDFRRLCANFLEIVKRVQPDQVIVQSNWQFAIAYAVRKVATHSYRLVYYHNGYRHNHIVKAQFARLAISLMLSIGADLVIAPSKFVWQQFPLLEQKSVIIPLGQDDRFFANPVTVDFSHGELRFVFCGEFRSGKNHEQLIEVFKKFHQRRGRANWSLTLPGGGPLLDRCRHVASKGSCRENLILPGPLDREKIKEIYDRSQFALVPTNIETFGHCIVEPFIRGRVVISRPVGVAEDLIRHGENGLVFNDWTELSQLLEVATGDLSGCKRMANMALSERDRFRWGTICDRLIEAMGGPRHT